MGVFKRFKKNNDENISEKQMEEVMDTNSSEIPPEMEQEHEIEDLVEEKEVETITSDANAEDLLEVDEGETVPIETTEMVEQEVEEEVEEEEEVVEVEVTTAEEAAKEVQVPKPEEKDSVNLSDNGMEDIQETETDLVDLVFDPSKKNYSDVKLNILEKRIETLLQKEKQLLNNPKIDSKQLEDIALCIQVIKSEIDDVKYETYRFSSEEQ